MNANLLDIINAILWSLTYLIGLVYLIATKRALISPLFSLIVVPWELAFFIRDLPRWHDLLFSNIAINWSEQGRLMFIVIHLPIVILLLFRSPDLKRKRLYYFYSFILISLLYLILYKINWNFQFVFGFMITVIGCALWVVSLLRRDIPISGMQILVAFIPTAADALAILYYGPKSTLGLVLSLVLIVVHMIHLMVAVVLYIKDSYFVKRHSTA